MTSPESIKTTVERLATQVQDLQIAHRSLRSELTDIKRSLQVQRETSDPEANPCPTSKTQKPVFSTGDRVIVKNPGHGRTNTGVVTGVTVADFIRVELSTGEIIRRLPKNLVKSK